MKTIPEYLNEIAKLTRGKSHILYRGHANKDWKLKPSVGRHYHGNWSNIVELEKTSFKEFQKKSVPHIQTVPAANSIEWLCLMQHHGCPTRLLNFTTNALIALFFASDPAIDSDTNKELDGAVLIAADQNIYSELDDDNLFSHQESFIYVPRHITSRISGQASCFLYSPTPNHDISKIVQEIAVPKDRKRSIREQLHKLDINYSHLFPGLDGLCKDLRDTLVSGLEFGEEFRALME